MSHMVRFFWAVHTVHHSSEKYNITVGFRSSVFEPLYRFLFFIPLGFIGFEAADIVLAFSIQQLYGSIIHTELIRRIPVWDWIFVSPSHHAVHHASNPRYLDKNMGMILIVWDKIFGTFEPEDEKYDKIKYGLTTNLNTYNPGNILFNEWRQMWHDVKSAPGIREKFMYVFGPPGWSHDGSRKTSHQLRFEEEQR
jgi:sterol desaturase/sphingolipid hydroxylase (fatty acid hydroxylase superfamily)